MVTLNESHTSGLNFVALVPNDDRQPQSSVLNCTKAKGYQRFLCMKFHSVM